MIFARGPGRSELLSLPLLAVLGGALACGTLPSIPGTDGASEERDAASQQTIPVSGKEVSRHPTAMPDTPNYTLFEDGRYREPVRRGDGPIHKEVHLNVQEEVREIVEGTRLAVWGFDGKVPAPMVRGRVGDTVDFYLHNPEDNAIPHNVDFHAVTGPGGGSVSLDTAPGSTSHLRAKLLKPGIYIYHCAFPDIPMHIAHGMYGLVVVEPKGGLPEVDQEYYIVQSGFYTQQGGDQPYRSLRNEGRLRYSSEYGNLEEPTFVTFNGRPEALTGERALGVYDSTVETGDTVRMFVGNIGPNLVSSFHVIGEMFDTVYVEGSFDLENHYVQSTLIPAGGAVGVEMKVEVPGDYVLVDHSIFRMHKGAKGVLRVRGEANPEVYEPIEHDPVR